MDTLDPQLVETIMQYKKYSDILAIEPGVVKLRREVSKKVLQELIDWWDAFQEAMCVGVKIELDPEPNWTTMGGFYYPGEAGF